MSELLHKEVRYDEPGGPVVTVQPPKTRLREGNRYYATYMKGALSCQFCTAAMVYSKGSELAGGSNLKGQARTFRLKRVKSTNLIA